jgi:hypothetical protein
MSVRNETVAPPPILTRRRGQLLSALASPYLDLDPELRQPALALKHEVKVDDARAGDDHLRFHAHRRGFLVVAKETSP